MDWLLGAPFITDKNDRWLGAYVSGNRHAFQAVPATYRHDRSRNRTSARQWLDYFGHGNAVWSQARARRRDGHAAGVITVFPQLAITVGLRNRTAMQHIPLLAWTFNLGQVYGGPKKLLARIGLAGVDRFIVHSRREIDSYSCWLELPQERFQFVPLQRFIRPVEIGEDDAQPFVLAMGSAQRDYRLFFAVIAELGYPAVVVAGAAALQGLTVPDNVRLLSNVDIAECRKLSQRARVNVVPVANDVTASGQVTLVDAMMYARATVATKTVGTEDYAVHEQTALLVAPGDHSAMKQAIERLWEDAAERRRLGAAARAYAQAHFSDEAIGAVMGGILDEMSGNARPVMDARR
jgi:glycosyltransferase involved in cell wall biosynthesis